MCAVEGIYMYYHTTVWYVPVPYGTDVVLRYFSILYFEFIYRTPDLIIFLFHSTLDQSTGRYRWLLVVAS